MNKYDNLKREDTISWAFRHVTGKDTHPVALIEESGAFQFEILKSNGLTHESRVLEIGCGCLNLGHRVIDFVLDNNYTGIEPHTVFVEAGKNFFKIVKPYKHLSVTNFDANDGKFDIIYSHSILSHASKYQLPEYFSACNRQLKTNGIALASLYMSHIVNGIEISYEDSNDEEWRYPDKTFFSLSTVINVANSFGLSVITRPDIRKGFMAATEGEHEHNWIELRLK